MKSPATILSFIEPEKIQTVIDDLRLVQEGYKLYYAIDPYEVFKFCFPMRSSDAEHEGVQDIDEFAADQAALYEICFKVKEKPLLVGDYVEELSGLMRYSAAVLFEAYDEAMVVDALIEKGGVESIATGQVEDLAETVQVISEKFHIVLAVAMGIYSLGSERFRQVYRDLVDDGHGLPENQPELQPHFESYRETPLSDVILGEIMKTASWANEHQFRSRRRSAFFDARAIDQLIHVNKSLMAISNQAPAVVLYLSSAQRTERAFELRATKNQLPLLHNQPFNFHRDRNHIFYRIAYRSDHGGVEETIKNLEKVKESVEELKKLNYRLPSQADYCSQCVLDGGQPNHCEMQATCEHLKSLLEPIEQRSTEIRNLALTQTMSRYEELKKAQPEGESQENLMKFFRRVFEDQKLKDVATQKKLEKEKLIFLQSVTAKVWAHSREPAQKQHLRAGRDSITGTMQYLPLKPRVNSPRYKEIVDLILNYYKTPPQGDAAKLEVIDHAYRLYLDQEAVTTDLDPQHELVRCLLYLTIPGTDGDRLAYDHALEMLLESSVLEEMEDSEAEFRYIACWSARRLKKFAEAHAQATLAIEKWPNDARFYHGRSLSKLAEWEEGTRDPERTPLLLEAEEAAWKSLDIYATNEDENREFIGVTYNNIVYINTLTVEVATTMETVHECLDKARAAVTKLKEYVPEKEWLIVHPNYFHTEALLDYHQAIKGSGNNAERRTMLEHAKRQIRHAIDSVAKDMYKDLLEKIEKALNLFK